MSVGFESVALTSVGQGAVVTASGDSSEKKASVPSSLGKRIGAVVLAIFSLIRHLFSAETRKAFWEACKALRTPTPLALAADDAIPVAATASSDSSAAATGSSLSVQSAAVAAGVVHSAAGAPADVARTASVVQGTVGASVVAASASSASSASSAAATGSSRSVQAAAVTAGVVHSAAGAPAAADAASSASSVVASRAARVVRTASRAHVAASSASSAAAGAAGAAGARNARPVVVPDYDTQYGSKFWPTSMTTRTTGRQEKPHVVVVFDAGCSAATGSELKNYWSLSSFEPFKNMAFIGLRYDAVRRYERQPNLQLLRLGSRMPMDLPIARALSKAPQTATLALDALQDMLKDFRVSVLMVPPKLEAGGRSNAGSVESKYPMANEIDNSGELQEFYESILKRAEWTIIADAYGRWDRTGLVHALHNSTRALTGLGRESYHVDLKQLNSNKHGELSCSEEVAQQLVDARSAKKPLLVYESEPDGTNVVRRIEQVLLGILQCPQTRSQTTHA